MMGEVEEKSYEGIVTRWWKNAMDRENSSESVVMISGWFYGASVMTVNRDLQCELEFLSDMLMDKFAGR